MAAPDYTNPLDTVVLTDPMVVQLRQDVSDQLLSQRGHTIPKGTSVDLTNAIADITYTLAIQGASFLEIDVIDPAGFLITDFGHGPFIDVDDLGFLQPITLEFPHGSGYFWEFCQYAPNSDTSSANAKMTFEYKAVEILRNLDQHDGPSASTPNETRLEFIIRLLKVAHLSLKEIFSQATIKFEESPPSMTPQQVVQWDNHWKQQQAQKQRQAQQLAALQQSVTDWFAAHQSGQDITQASPPATGTNARNQWWAKNAPGAEQVGSADYVPNAGYIPGLGN